MMERWRNKVRNGSLVRSMCKQYLEYNRRVNSIAPFDIPCKALDRFDA